MMSARRRVLGFTMVELMITLTVVLVISMIAVPSFISFRQRAALRAAAEQTQGFWNQARFEAAKRNSLVKVGVFANGASYCLGATTTTIDATDHDEPCDCLSDGECDVGVFPALVDVGGTIVSDQSAWRGVTLNGTPTLGSDSGAAVLESRRTTLINPTMAGAISLAAPDGPNDYRLNMLVDRQGRATLCQSTNAPDKMSDYINRNCAP